MTHGKKECLAVRPGEATELSAETGKGAEPIARRRVAVPVVDIIEREDGVYLRADIPGVKADGVDVTVDRDVLTLRGKPVVAAPAGLQLIYREYEPVDYERTFALGRDVDREAITARVEDGVLEVYLPKGNAAKTRKVSVQSA